VDCRSTLKNLKGRGDSRGKMSLSKEVDISRALDTAETRGVSGDPIMRKLRITLQDGKEKHDGSKKKAVKVLATLTRIGECLAEVSPFYGAAWNERMKCTTGTDQADQEHEAMVETAHRLYVHTRHSARRVARRPWP
jgi:hypothetical protein